MDSRPVMDRDLADPKPLGMRKRRNEAVQLSVEIQRLGNLASIDFEAAVEVPHLEPGDRRGDRVEDPGLHSLEERVLALLFPAADEVVALVEPVQHARNIVRVVLQIRVEGEDDFATRDLEPCLQGCCLPKTTSQLDEHDMWVAREQLGAECNRTVGATVVDKDDFVGALYALEDSRELARSE